MAGAIPTILEIKAHVVQWSRALSEDAGQFSVISVIFVDKTEYCEVSESVMLFLAFIKGIEAAQKTDTTIDKIRRILIMVVAVLCEADCFILTLDKPHSDNKQ